MTALEGMDSMELQALEVRTTCTARQPSGRVVSLTVYWLDLMAVRDAGEGEVVDPVTGKRRTLVWDDEDGYSVS